MKTFTPLGSPLLDQFYHNFLSTAANKKEISVDLKKALEESKELRKMLHTALRTGKNCSKQAIWIGLDGYVSFYTQLSLQLIVISRSNKKNREHQINQHMVETKALQKLGLKTGALQEKDGDAFFLDEKWHRVCAPRESESGKMFPLIFWNKQNSEDKLSWNNQVSCCVTFSNVKDLTDVQFGAVVYNLGSLSFSFSSSESGLLKTECQAIYQNVW